MIYLFLFTVTLKLDDAVEIDYSLTRSPTVESNYIDIYLKVSYFYEEADCKFFNFCMLSEKEVVISRS